MIKKTGLLYTKQLGLFDHVINAVGLDDGMDKGKYAPAGSVTLVKNEYGVPASGSFNYISVLGRMLYIYGHTSPGIAFAVNCCAIYMFCP